MMAARTRATDRIPMIGRWIQLPEAKPGGESSTGSAGASAEKARLRASPRERSPSSSRIDWEPNDPSAHGRAGSANSAHGWTVLSRRKPTRMRLPPPSTSARSTTAVRFATSKAPSTAREASGPSSRRIDSLDHAPSRSIESVAAPDRTPSAAKAPPRAKSVTRSDRSSSGSADSFQPQPGPDSQETVPNQ